MGVLLPSNTLQSHWSRVADKIRNCGGGYCKATAMWFNGKDDYRTHCRATSRALRKKFATARVAIAKQLQCDSMGTINHRATFWAIVARSIFHPSVTTWQLPSGRGAVITQCRKQKAKLSIIINKRNSISTSVLMLFLLFRITSLIYKKTHSNCHIL